VRSYWLLSILISVLPCTLPAQPVHRTPVKKAAPTKLFVLPVSPTTGRVAYYDTVRVTGAEGKDLIHDVLDIFHRNALYYRDGPWPSSTDTTAAYALGPPAATGETVFWGSIIMFAPTSRPRSVYVPGISPLPSKGDQPPAPAGPPDQQLNFALRLRAEVGICYITVTDLRQHPLSDTWANAVRQYRLTHPGRLPVALLSQPVETLYADWLPHPLAPAGKPPLPASRPPGQATESQAREADAYARELLNLARYALRR
jgi:hypothetical protein